MHEYMLKNYIPLGAPATRRPCEGQEGRLRISVGFCPRWYTQRLGIDFSKRWHTDPIYRYDTLLTMKRYLNTRFPSVEEFMPKQWNTGVERDCATLSGVFGIKLIAMLYGQKPRYVCDDWPEGEPNSKISPQKLAGMPQLSLADNPIVNELDRQMDILESEYGIIDGFLNYQGVLNTAFALCGSDIFLTIVDDPECARAVFSNIAHTMGAIAKRVQTRQRKSGFDIDLISVSNCVINMISPEQYESLLLPFDQWLSSQFERFGVHTCNWNATQYFPAINRIDKIGYIDMGITSDMRLAQKLFPNARRAVLYTPLWLEQKTIMDLRADIERIYNELSPCDIILADISDSTKDDRINEFLTIAQEVANELS